MITSNSKKPKQFYETAKYLFGQRFLGGGILTQLNNIQWAKQRKMMNPAFRRGWDITISCKPIRLRFNHIQEKQA